MICMSMCMYMSKTTTVPSIWSMGTHTCTCVWAAHAEEDNDDEDVVGDNGVVCALCCIRSIAQKLFMCDKCQLIYCIDCIDTHTHPESQHHSNSRGSHQPW